MPTINITSTKDASAWKEANGWNGKDDHHPVGKTTEGDTFRSFVYFPIDWNSLNAISITSATLSLTRKKYHMDGTTSSTLKIARMTKDWGEGNYGTEGFWSGSETWDWDNRAVSSAFDESLVLSYTAGTPNNNAGVTDTFDVVDIVRKWAPTSVVLGENKSNYGFILYNGSLLDEDGLEYYSREGAPTASDKPKLTIVYEIDTRGRAPKNLTPVANAITTTVPTFTGQIDDDNTNDYLTKVEIIAYSDSGGTVQVWNSGVISLTGSPTSFSVTSSYTFLGNTDYWWKAAVWDRSDLKTPYSSLLKFHTNTVPPTPTGLSPASGSTLTTLVPNFSGSSSDPDPGDSLSKAQIIVYNDSAGTNARWDSGEVTVSGSSFSVAYGTIGTGGTGGASLSTSSTYYWKARTKDTNGQFSEYTQLQTFTTYAPGGPTGLSPSGEKVNTLTPTLTATATETMNAFQVLITSSNLTTTIYDSGTYSASGTAISYVVPAGANLQWATKYGWRVRSRNGSNVWSSYSSDAGQPFWTNATPAASKISPANNSIVPTLTPSYVSGFSDADIANGFSESPSEYVVEVRRNSDNALMHTLTKSSSLTTGQNSVTRASEGTALSWDVTYKWDAKFNDGSGAANAAGAFSGTTRIFKPSQSPTVSSFVAQASDLTSGKINNQTPTFTYSFSGSSGKTQTQKRMLVIRNPGTSDEVQIYDSGLITSTTNSFTIQSGVIENQNEYQFVIDAYDADQLYGTANVIYSVEWVPPDDPEGISLTGNSDYGNVTVNWSVSSLTNDDFNRYSVYRLKVGETDEYSLIFETTNKFVNSYNDYATGFGINYQYKVTQWKNITGSSPLESVGATELTTSIPSDDWMIVVPERDDLATILNVQDEQHQADVSEEVFEPFGRSRKVIVRSGVLGSEGSVDFVMPNDEREATISKLKAASELNQTIYIKSPFGDYFKIYMRPPSIRYLNNGNARGSIDYVEVE